MLGQQTQNHLDISKRRTIKCNKIMLLSTNIRILDAFHVIKDNANMVQESSKMTVLTGTTTINLQ